MKKTLIALSLLSIVGISEAAYDIKIPLEEDKGGSLPNGSISIPQKITTPENWTDASPVYTAWMNKGSLYNCTWTPAASTVTAGESFTQTASDCQQDQNRNKQEREIESESGMIRNKGSSTNENQVITVSANQQAIGIKETNWECPEYSQLQYSWFQNYSSNYILWNGGYAYVRYNIESPYTDVEAGYIYRKGVLRLSDENGSQFFELCRSKI